jgi:mannose-6-phosphate isomerase-like protein (cupin superfamily)
MGHKTATRELGAFWFEGDIKKATLKNSFFRRVVYTGPHSQLALMNVDPGDDTNEEKREDADTILFVVRGKGKSVLNGRKRDIGRHDVIFVPAGNPHNLSNPGREDLKLFVVYSPPVFSEATVHKTQKDATAEMTKQFAHAWEQ